MTEDKRLKQLRELGLTISYYRKLKGLTQGQLASLVGLSISAISKHLISRLPYPWTVFWILLRLWAYR